MNKFVHNFLWRRFPIPCLVAGRKFALIFKTTHWCWYKCAHCCENCGPARPREYIPQSVITGYIDAAMHNPKFSKQVVFTGGEVMSAYLYGPRDYVPNILRHALSAGCGTDIKTNAAWVRAKFGEQIFDDLATIANEYPQKLQVSLSIDAFHKNAMENNLRFIREMARRRASLVVHMSSFAENYGMAEDEFVRALRKSGLSVDDAAIINNHIARPVHVINNNIIMLYGTGKLFASGRAEKLSGAEYQVTPQFQIMASDGDILVAFDAAGSVQLGEAGRHKIQTKWRKADGDVRSLSAIRFALVRNAYLSQERYLFKQIFSQIFSGGKNCR